MASELAAYLADKGYNPRSSFHSDFQSRIIIRDLVRTCPLIAVRASKGEIVAQLRHHQHVGHADWVIDVAMGTCVGTPQPPSLSDDEAPLIRFAPPVIIQIAIELKGVFTEHGKARLNRLRDFAAFHGHGHQYDPRTVVAALLVINSAEHFYSPLNYAKAGRPEINSHGSARRSARQLAAECVEEFRSVHLRRSETDQPGLEALGVVVVEHDNISLYPDPQKYADLHRPTRVAPCPPNPTPGDPLSYESFIQRVCAHYTQRFGGPRT